MALCTNGLVVRWKNPTMLLMSSYVVLNVFYMARFGAAALMLP